jgi:hypothetical protein
MGVYENAKDLVKLAHEAGNIEIHRRSVDLMEQVLALSQEKFDLTQENAALKEKLRQRDEFYPKDNAFWRKKSDGSEDGPYCSLCWQDLGKVIRLEPKHVGNHFAGNECPKCKKYDKYIDPPRHAPQVIPARPSAFDRTF